MIIHGTGCCLIDFLYADEDFSGPSYREAQSRRSGDGGLSPGRLVFAADFERFMGLPYEEALKKLTGGKAPSSHNLGGPSAVALTQAAQLLDPVVHEVRFFGVRGADETGARIEAALNRLPFKEYRLAVKEGPSPRTDVLSDPRYDQGHGERSFISSPGTAALFGPDDLGDDFFNADIIAFGGTALVPILHDNFTELLTRARNAGAFTVVNLVYDFRSELAGAAKWKLGRNDDAYPCIDLLIADRDEAERTSGRPNEEDAAAWFLAQGVGATAITRGTRPLYLAAGPGAFSPLAAQTMPVCEAIDRDLAARPERRGDTAGCGDNFAGGVITGLAEQLAQGRRRGNLDLRAACTLGVVSGGFACFTMGGVFYESRPREKRKLMAPYLAAYLKELERFHG